MASEALFHAYIFAGTRESTRDAIEQLLASHGVTKATTEDFLISEYVHFSIDNARALRSWQQLGSVGKHKVHIIYTEFISREAENALLKVLEEPTPGTHIIFALPKPETLLPTLLSRVRVVGSANRTKGHSFGGMRVADFLKLSLAERIAHIGKMVEKSENDEASAEVRQKAILSLEALEHALGAHPHENKENLARILRCKKYLFSSGASVKMILETIALTL